MTPDQLEKASELAAQVAARVAEEKAAAGAQDATPAATGVESLDQDFLQLCLDKADRGAGMIFARLNEGKLAYVGQSDEWMYWTGSHWAIDKAEPLYHAHAATEDVADAFGMAARHWKANLKMARSSGADTDVIKKLEARVRDFRTAEKRMHSTNGIASCILEGRRCSTWNVAVDGERIDQKPMLLACKNGVIDLETGELIPGRPHDLLVRHSSVEWKGIDEPCPQWEKFLLEIMGGDEDMVAYLRRIFGYSIGGRKRDHVFLMLSGQGRNGKSLMVEVICHVLSSGYDESSLAGPIQAEMLLDQGKGRSAAGPSPDIMRMRGLRLAIASETDDGQRFSSSRVKWLSGGDTLTGRAPHDKRNTTFLPTHLLCLLTNHKPYAPGDDYAFWARLQLVNFPITFVEDREPEGPNERRMDKTLKERLLQESSGILAWLVRGFLEYSSSGLCPPDKVKGDTKEYQLDEDDIGRFLEDCCDIDPNMRENSSSLYKAFTWWASQNMQGQKIASQKRFGATIQKRFEKSKVDGRYWYYGVKVSAFTLESMASDEAESSNRRGSF